MAILALTLPPLLFLQIINCLHNRSIELSLLGHQGFDIISNSMGVEILLGCMPLPFRMVFAGTYPPMTIRYGVRLSCSAVLVAQSTELVGLPRRLVSLPRNRGLHPRTVALLWRLSLGVQPDRGRGGQWQILNYF